MSRYEGDEGLSIGEALKRARAHRKLDVSTVEDRTKIRIKYLRAMESDEWDVLPNHAYAKGFLRTYAQLLGLDGDALVDQYRRQVESALPDPGAPFGETLLERRRPLGRSGGGREPGGVPTIALLGAGALAVLALLLVLGLTGGDDGGGKRDRKQGQQANAQRKDKGAEQRNEAPQQPPTPQATLRMTFNSDVPVCVLDASGKPVLNGTATAGQEKGPFESPTFRLLFPSGYDLGQFQLFLGGKATRLPELQGPAAFEITPPDNFRQVTFPPAGCP
jgi:Helix-turn-helix domain